MLRDHLAHDRMGLSTAVVDEDGVTACKYLTPKARISFERHTPADPTCETFFGNARLALGGLDVQSDHDLAHLTYTVVPDGADRVVEVSHDGQSFALRLVPATPTESQTFQPPVSDWRIDSSVAALAGPTPSIHSRL